MMTKLFEVTYGAVGEEPNRRDTPAESWQAKHKAMRFLRVAAQTAEDRGDIETAEKLAYCALRLRECLHGEVLFGLSIRFHDRTGVQRHVTIAEAGVDYRDAATTVNGDTMPSVQWLAEYREAGRRVATIGQRTGAAPPPSQRTAVQKAGAALAGAARKAVS